MQELGCGVRMEGGVGDRSRGWSDFFGYDHKPKNAVDLEELEELRKHILP